MMKVKIEECFLIFSDDKKIYMVLSFPGTPADIPTSYIAFEVDPKKKKTIRMKEGIDSTVCIIP